jgi:Trk K+ transport system NAD-binding subunit
LLQFETPLPLPESERTRLIFFLVPVAGVFVLGQGVVGLGRALFDREAWSRAMAETTKRHVVVCGLGQVSIAAIEWLRALGEEVVVVELNSENQLVESARSLGAIVVIGDATRAGTLESAGILKAESIVPCTNSDLVNLEIALEARRLVPDIKIVLRMINSRMAQNVRVGFNIPTALSIAEICAPAFAAAATRAPLDHAFSFGEGANRRLFTITKFTMNAESSVAGIAVGELENHFDVAVIARQKRGAIELHPHDSEKLEPGDTFVVSASLQALEKLAKVVPPASGSLSV